MAEITSKTIIYIARDLERALGQQSVYPSYFIITNSTPFAKEMANQQTNIIVVESDQILDTPELLVRPEVKDFINEQTNPHLLVFKNLPIIEKICAANNWPLLNPSAKLAQSIEEKISQIEWLGDLVKFLPPNKIKILKEVEFLDTPFIVQFNRAHTGGGTILIDSQEKLTELISKFPDRPVRVTDFINGSMLTSNNIVSKNEIIVGNINYQITGLEPFTDNLFATIGNDWSLPSKLLNEEQKNTYTKIVTAVGEKLRTSGWKGLFGTDLIFSETGELFLIEINARQPASTTYESVLQKNITTFEAHLLSLNNEPVNQITQINEGAQIILRQREPNLSAEIVATIQNKLVEAGFICTPYSNTEPGADLLRIQSKAGIMTAQNKFNELGQKIVSIIESEL